MHNSFRYSGGLWDDTTSLQYLRARWYDPSEGRFVSEDSYQGSISNPLTLNLYTYVHNNPLIFGDPSGHKIWLIHGTFSDSETWTPEFRKYVEELFNESSETLDWLGKNTKRNRSESAEAMFDKIYKWHKENPDEPIRLVGHSHGGSIAIMVSNMLAEKEKKVDTLITVATPVREYKLETEVGQHIQVYNNRDSVQMDMAGRMWLLGMAITRAFANAENVRAKDGETGTKVQAHSTMHSNPDIWEKYVEPILKR